LETPTAQIRIEALQEASMSAALAKPELVPVGIVKQFGPYGTEYEVLGSSAPERGKSMVRIVLVRTGEEVTYEYDAMMQDPEAR
jgi:hypothetical protein